MAQQPSKTIYKIKVPVSSGCLNGAPVPGGMRGSTPPRIDKRENLFNEMQDGFIFDEEDADEEVADADDVDANDDETKHAVRKCNVEIDEHLTLPQQPGFVITAQVCDVLLLTRFI